MITRELAIDEIIIRKGRLPDEAQVVRLMESIADQGLLQPVGVSSEKKLIYGLNRLTACHRIGWKSVPCVMVDLDDVRSELAEIDENLMRRTLPAIEESRLLARRKELYEVIHPDKKHGGDRGNQHTGGKTTDCRYGSFSEDTAEKTGRSRRTVERAVELGEKIAPAAVTQLVGTPVENSKVQLKLLSELDEQTQVSVAKAIANGKARSVSQAVKMLQPDDEPEEDTERAEKVKKANKAYGQLVRAIYALDLFDELKAPLTKIQAALK